MKILQSFNQNALLVADKNNDEFIVLGKGIGFKKKAGDTISSEGISRIFRVNYSRYEKDIQDSIKDVPEDLLVIVDNISQHVEETLNTKLDPVFIVALASHIHFSMKYENTIDHVDVPLDYGLNYLFPKEYKAAKWAIDYLFDEYGINLPNSEVTYFTFHFVNGALHSDTNEMAMELGLILNDVLKVMERFTPNLIEQNSIHVSRFIVHIRYFLFRQMNAAEKTKCSDFKDVYNLTAEKFTDAELFVEKLTNLFQEKYSLVCSPEERFYLLIHVQRLINENVENDSLLK